MSQHDSHHSSSGSSGLNGGGGNNYHNSRGERSPSSHHGGGSGGHNDRRYNDNDRRLSSRDYDRRRDSHDNNRNNERRLSDSRGHDQHSRNDSSSRYDRRLSDTHRNNNREDSDDYYDTHKRYNNNYQRNNEKRYYQRENRDSIRDNNRDSRDSIRDNNRDYRRDGGSRDSRENSYHGKRSYKDYEDSNRHHHSDRYNSNRGSRNYSEKGPSYPHVPPEDPEPKYGSLADAFSHLSKTINDYANIRKLGEGTYGEVFQAKIADKPGFVAAKKMRSDLSKEKQAGFPITTIREIKILRELNHENIVKLLDISWDDKSFFMIFEFVDHDLAGLSEMGVKFTESHLRFFMYQLIDALYYCHSSNVYHRDLKTSNILIRKDGTLKLADFGLSLFKKRTDNNYTNKVVTRWYRAPDVLLGSTSYGASIDMWSVGCIFGELLLRERALFMGENETDQLVQIFNCCGTPDVEDWPEVVELEGWEAMKPKEPIPNTLRKRFEGVHCSEKALDLLERLLTFNPKKRITAKEALNHEWFFEDGHPLSHNPRSVLPRETTNELTARNARPNNHQRSSGAVRRYERQHDYQPSHKKQR